MPRTSSRLSIARTAVAAAGVTALSHALPVAAPGQRQLSILAQRPAPSRKPPGDGLTMLSAWPSGFRKPGNAKR